MENRFVFSQSKGWPLPRGPSSFVKAVGISDSMTTHSHDLSQHTTTQIISEKMAEQIMKCLRESFASYPAYEVVSLWVSALLWTPFDVAAKVAKTTLHATLNLPPFISMVVLPLLLCYIVYCFVDYCLTEWQNFLDLGRGGTPSTPIGLFKATMKRYFANVNVFEPPHIHPMLEPYRGRLFGLKKRNGARPIVKGVAPQRQLNQKTPVETFNKLLQMLKDIAATDANLKVTTSYLEGHTDALKAIFADRPHEVWGTDSEWDFEIAHPHRIDGSMHVILHPEDCRTVIEKGWGERHTLTSEATWWRIFYHYIRLKRRPVPYNLMLVYAPRTDAEYKVLQQIVEAAVWFSKEKDICDKINQGLLARTDDGTILTREEALSVGYVDGPIGKLVTIDRAIDQRWYKLTPCGTGAIPLFKSGPAVPLPTQILKYRQVACG